MKYLKVIIIIVIIIIIGLVLCIKVITDNNSNDVNNLNMNFQNNINNSNANNTNSIDISNNTNNSENGVTIEEKENYGDVANITGTKQKVTSENMFYVIENCVQSYINNITDRNALAIYNQLSTSYISTNGINTSNVLNYVENISGNQEFRALQMYYVQGKNYDQYSVYGKILNSTGNTNEIYLIVNINTGNLRYSIIPQINNNYTDLSQVKINITNEEINENNNNQGSYIRITDEQHIKNIIKDYQKNALYDTENAYKSLDEEYRKKRFINYSDYFNYVKNNATKIQSLNLVSYSKNVKTGYTQYICKDNYENIYTINSTGIMEYTIILDDYTLQTESDINSYNNLTNKQKAEKNVKKVINMINTCDYNHLYNLLYDKFKSNYFSNQQDMEKVIKQTFSDYNIITSLEVNESEEGIYMCVVRLTDSIRVSAVTNIKTIMIQLGSGTDFKMSFDI